MKLKRVWTFRHWRVTLVYGLAATAYALLVKIGIEPLLPERYLPLPAWLVPLTANFGGIVGAIGARLAWFDRP